MFDFTEDLIVEDLIRSLPPLDIMLCPTCGGFARTGHEPKPQIIAVRGGRCRACYQKHTNDLKDAASRIEQSISRDRIFYKKLSTEARIERRRRIALKESADRQQQYLLWRCRRWFRRTLRAVLAVKQSQAAKELFVKEHSDPLGLRECSKCTELKFLYDFPKTVEGLYLAKICKRCKANQKHLVRARENLIKRQRRAERPIDITSLVLPLTDVERKLANRRSKKASKKRQRADPIHRIHRNFSEVVRSHIKKFKQKKPVGGWQAVVGYTIHDLKEHLESKFEEGMSWENYGEWHIDHITPKSAFKVEHYGDPQFLACWDLTNLQPLWAEDNVNKSNSLIWNRYNE